ncbi:MAG: SDR family NAD(P)-dependent oxidoreductase [Alphaproteobacteria bacterium]|nr:SDR family NAD(P)-dependent oxidoreductase [Alphaproteobacteria bacterium]MBU1559470.1 SDR family NAD(P)-dependent oxidoreductase [Alphaproteobacteria bacterium]MBU2301522.1 SDR family NAD(P)-dependent oxidoreductase [Alphaproteobacteria bacterium]MBU2369749.1 SDR family NAD(P)-dependent oxidoreductase [Alphaproteobacteria bacterium]
MAYDLATFPPTGLAVVIGASGGIGAALHQALSQSEGFDTVVGLSRSADGFDLTDEASIAQAAASVAALGLPLRLVIVATGLLHDGAMQPEKSWRQLDPQQLARSFAINATGPMLVAKHFLPLLPREGKAVFAAVSAKVGSIGDNQLGGWYGYRAAKAALNQLMHTAAIELRRTRPEAICVTLHPGTVATGLSAPFRSSGHEPVAPGFAAERLLRVIDGLGPADAGLLLDHSGVLLPW